MRYPLSMWCVVVFLTLLKYAGKCFTFPGYVLLKSKQKHSSVKSVPGTALV